jgi:YbgC/YbaW family acyl-CoA thioester hydrolase
MDNTFYYEMIIREHHLDSYGHVNNATYVQILEEARWECITQRGYGYKEVQQTKKGPVILDLQVAFRKEVKLREVIKISVQTDAMKGKIGIINQKILKADGSLSVEAKVTYGMFDLAARKLIDATPEWLVAIGQG